MPHSHPLRVLLALVSPECIKAGNSLTTSLPQNKNEKVPKVENASQENALDFGGSFEIAINSMWYVSVSIGQKTYWTDAVFL